MPPAPIIVKQARRSTRAQIVEHLRQSLSAGDYAPGTQLPSMQKLAETWSTQVPTVHRAIAQLAREGWLERVPRIGTFVRQREHKLTAAGIYLPMSDLAKPDSSRFARALCKQLQLRLATHDLASQVWLDAEEFLERSTVWPAVVQAAAQHRIQGLLVPNPDASHIAAVAKLAIPAALHSTGHCGPGTVAFDLNEWTCCGVQALAQAECRRLGFLSVAAPRRPQDPAPGPLDTFVAEASARGLEIRPAWIRPASRYVPESEAERFGYDECAALLREPELPDGLLVFTDVAARGALLALAQAGIQIPRQMQLVLHRNAELGLLCPVPAWFVEVSIAETAELMIAQLLAQFAGQPAPLCRLSFRICHP